ncbi:MAG: four helix bundle protein [Bacteroidales bacterium]|jgi:four helix bundle protein|nr:four helix bundle protein [Bacteroidales bacterium]
MNLIAMENDIVKLSYCFSLRIIQLYRELVKEKEFTLSKQLLRSATSIGANVCEATAAISKKEFVHKMSIASKEAREAYYWLRLLNDSKLVNIDFSSYLAEISSIINVLTKIVKTTQMRIQEG